MTGQHMADYPADDGVFLAIASEILATNTLIRWYKEGVAIKRAQEYAANPAREDGGPVAGLAAALAATLPAPGGDHSEKPVRPPGKATYQCQECGNKVWGKPGLSLICGDCHAIDGRIFHLEVVSSYPSGVPG